MSTKPNRVHYTLVLDSPLGQLGVAIEDGAIVRLDYLVQRVPLQPATTALEQAVEAQLGRFFATPAERFTLPVALCGTDFQRRVWRALTRIAPGETRTYGELAAELGSGARAVGNACRRNPVSIIVPCHRVVAAAGPGGYSGRTGGAALKRKLWLLRHEQSLAIPLKSRRQTPPMRMKTNPQRTLHA